MTVYPMQGKAPYCTNCYLTVGDVPDEQGFLPAVLVDASLTPQQVRVQLEKYHARLWAILLTHGHADHVEQLAALRAAFDVGVWLDERDARQFGIAATHAYTAAPVTAGDLSLAPVFTPGHTPGSTCLVCGGVLFCGDTLFAGSVGRTDLPGGDGAQLCRSLWRLCQRVGQNLQILPGHGGFSTMEEEKRFNPYLRYALKNPQGSF